MGIGYSDSIILYNRSMDGDAEHYFGALYENVRIELTQGENISKSGNESADICKVKIPSEGIVETFKADSGGDFFVIVKKDALNINISDLPIGDVDSDNYRGGFFQWCKETYRHAYRVHTLDVYELIPRFEIGGR